MHGWRVHAMHWWVARLLGKAEVDHLDVTLRVEQQVLRLEIAVDDLPVVQILEGRYDDRRVEGGHGLLEVG